MSPLRYHKSDSSNVCPFGARCFYAHLDANGADVKNRPAPPPPQGPPRRSCPYLRGEGARGAGRGPGVGGTGGGHGHRGMGHGHGAGVDRLNNLRNLYTFEFEGETRTWVTFVGIFSMICFVRVFFSDTRRGLKNGVTTKAGVGGSHFWDFFFSGSGLSRE